MDNSIKNLQKRAYENSLNHGFHELKTEKAFGDVILSLLKHMRNTEIIII